MHGPHSRSEVTCPGGDVTVSTGLLPPGRSMGGGVVHDVLVAHPGLVRAAVDSRPHVYPGEEHAA